MTSVDMSCRLWVSAVVGFRRGGGYGSGRRWPNAVDANVTYAARGEREY